MRLALFDVCARLNPVTRLSFKFFPVCPRGLDRAATGQHYEPDAVGGAAGILGKRVADRCQLGLGEEAFLGLFVVLLNTLARIALRRITPRERLAGLWYQRQRKHFRTDRQDTVSTHRPAGLGDSAVHVGDIATVYVGHLSVLAEFVADLGQHLLLVVD